MEFSKDFDAGANGKKEERYTGRKPCDGAESLTPQTPFGMTCWVVRSKKTARQNFGGLRKMR